MASSTFTRTGIQPVETPEVVDAVAARLRAYAPFTAHVGHRLTPSGPAGALHVHRLGFSAAGEDEAVPMYALLREMAGYEAADRPEGLVVVRLQLLVSIDPAGVADPDRVLSRAHVLAWRCLEGALLDGGEGEGRFVSTAPVTRSSFPSAARLTDDGRLFSAALFAAAVRPQYGEPATYPLPEVPVFPAPTTGVTEAQARAIARGEAVDVLADAFDNDPANDPAGLPDTLTLDAGQIP